MKIESATAVRNKGIVKIFIWGYLSRIYSDYKIVDKYPGGNIAYVRDPGSTQVFIECISGNVINTEAITPWISGTQIEDSFHSKVDIYVDRELVKTVPIFEYDTTDTEVISMFVETFDCSFKNNGEIVNKMGRRIRSKLAVKNETNEYIQGAELRIVWEGDAEDKGEVTALKVGELITRDSTKVGNGDNYRKFVLKFYRKDHLMGERPFTIYNPYWPADAGKEDVKIRARESDGMVQLTERIDELNGDIPFGTAISIKDWNN